MRRDPQQHLALGQRLAHQPEGALREIAQPAMDQLGRGRRGAGGEIVLLDQQDLEAASGGIARNADAVDAAPDDGEIEVRHAAPADSPLGRSMGPKQGRAQARGSGRAAAGA